MSLNISKPLVSVDWLFNNLANENLIILDATIPKVTATNAEIASEKIILENALFFDIKNVFSDVHAEFPNTVLPLTRFELEAKYLGIHNNSTIIVYDDLGIYSSARVWWLFKLMGFENIAVLDGGLPAWKKANYPIASQHKVAKEKGNFTGIYQPQLVTFVDDVLEVSNNKTKLILDARSKGRFDSTVPEPRVGVKSGHIPNSKNLPFADVLHEGKFKSVEELKIIFKTLNPNEQPLVFSCGTGITACVLALGAEISDIKNYTVYDGSWTEWGSTENLPIEK
ncbi:thiosulfate/3-mercaptopyruvate sulfurtransferase [Lutibacter sp. Hel_I_33_5]|uniref:sulfurtransferase n=1 Tax=Lutibacter sp. Hel_I_33_5 TaxID=1566289 RepID=UPI0011ADAB5B|nr:sulfurtransferase [Lutibacter sp. Hel_I_33_5]TVZ54805.1 thiosulfate/3-mercaptopyruvate sulfurtransferase [Lutibacter sp. Hel_I_33_5]